MYSNLFYHNENQLIYFLCTSQEKQYDYYTAPPVQKPHHLRNVNQKLKLIFRLRWTCCHWKLCIHCHNNHSYV